MTRAELLTLAVKVWDRGYLKGTTRDRLDELLREIEPLIRADERGKWLAYDESVTRDEWAELRAKVLALPARGVVYPYDLDSLVPEALLYRADVLALFDGSSDE